MQKSCLLLFVYSLLNIQSSRYFSMLKQMVIVVRLKGCVICLELHNEYLFLGTELRFHGCNTVLSFQTGFCFPFPHRAHS